MSNTKEVYQTDHEGYFTAATFAHESPLEPGVYHIPAGAYEDAPPEEAVDGDRWLRKDNAWTLVKYVPPTPVKPPIPRVPVTCTPAQGLIALYALKGITEDQVLAAIDQIEDPLQRYTAKIGYNKAVSWDRNSQSMQVIATLLALSEDDLDELFTFAVTIQS